MRSQNWCAPKRAPPVRLNGESSSLTWNWPSGLIRWLRRIRDRGISNDLTDEPVALARNGLNVAWILFVVPQHPSNLAYRMDKSVFGDEGVLPDCIEQFLFFNYATGVLQQKYQCLERL